MKCEMSRIGKCIEMESRRVVAVGWGAGDSRVMAKEYRVSRGE